MYKRNFVNFEDLVDILNDLFAYLELVHVFKFLITGGSTKLLCEMARLGNTEKTCGDNKQLFAICIQTIITQLQVLDIDKE